MRIGILTIHHVINYGAVWQACSLARTVAKMGVEVEIIDYRPINAINFYREPWIKRKRPNVYGVIRQYLFSKFIKRLPLGPVRCSNAEDLAGQMSRYDMIIAGSDQIWCTGDGSFRGYDSNFFMRFVNNPKLFKISYAASAGNTSDFAENEEPIAEALKRFDALGVRDGSTAELVERTSHKQTELVLDPVFLNDFEDIESSKTNEMVVFAKNPKSLEKVAKAILAKTPMRVVSMDRACSFQDVHLKAVSPEEWAKRIKGARVVLTDYFHGVAVALRFRVPVVVASPSHKAIKITDLLAKLGLMDFYVDGSDKVIAAANTAIEDPEAFKILVSGRLKEHEDRSLAFLRNSIEAAKSSHGLK